MSFAEKASLANKYLGIFHIHMILFGTLGLILIIVPLLIAWLYHSSSDNLFVLLIAGMLIGAIIIYTTALTDIQNYSLINSHPNSAQIDINIIHKHRQLPMYKRHAKLDYRKLSQLHGSKAYNSKYNSAYIYNRNRVKNDTKYLKSHNPKAPWLNIKF